MNQLETFGDSIEASTIGGAVPWPEYAGSNFRSSINPKSVLSSVNFGVFGELQSVSFGKAQSDIPLLPKPANGGVNFAQWKMWSANDGVTAATILSDYNTYVPAFIALCQQYGVIPIMGTHMPTSQITVLSADNQRVASNNALRALAAASNNTVLLADYDLALSAGQVSGNQALYIAGYSNDGVHPNAAGALVMAGILQTTIKAYLGD